MRGTLICVNFPSSSYNQGQSLLSKKTNKWGCHVSFAIKRVAIESTSVVLVLTLCGCHGNSAPANVYFESTKSTLSPPPSAHNSLLFINSVSHHNHQYLLSINSVSHQNRQYLLSSLNTVVVVVVVAIVKPYLITHTIMRPTHHSSRPVLRANLWWADKRDHKPDLTVN